MGQTTLIISVAAVLLNLDEALTRFAESFPRQAKVVELRFLAGLSVEETAEVLGVSPRTAKVDWQMIEYSGAVHSFTQPMAGLFGPKVMVINERAGSGGDLLPYLFRFKKIGPLVGTKTWGGLVGTWDTPPLIDGGGFVAPRGGEDWPSQQ